MGVHCIASVVAFRQKRMRIVLCNFQKKAKGRCGHLTLFNVDHSSNIGWPFAGDSGKGSTVIVGFSIRLVLFSKRWHFSCHFSVRLTSTSAQPTCLLNV